MSPEQYLESVGYAETNPNETKIFIDGWNAALENQWQPIETAPMNQEILVLIGRFSVQVTKTVFGYHNSYDPYSYLPGDKVTHWMPVQTKPGDNHV